MPPVAGLHIVELAEVNPRFSGFLSRRGSVIAATLALRSSSRLPNRGESLPFRSNQPAPHGDGRHFDPAVDAELGEEAGHVGLDRARANAESRGDLPVVVSRHQQAEDVQLARAEPR